MRKYNDILACNFRIHTIILDVPVMCTYKLPSESNIIFVLNSEKAQAVTPPLNRLLVFYKKTIVCFQKDLYGM